MRVVTATWTGAERHRSTCVWLVGVADGTAFSLRWRALVAQGFAAVEDVVYVGLGLLLAVTAGALLFSSVKHLATVLAQGSLAGQAVAVLDQILLILLVVELLYTVQVSFREHGLLAEPFLVVALIAVIRRVLILTAEVSKLPEAGEAPFRHAILELGLLTVMIVVLVGSLIAMQRQSKDLGHNHVL
jgi:uncharacterized membrane protein (DUF373 family)